MTIHIGPFHPCPTCGTDALIWPDNSDGVTVNFACPNTDCKAGKPKWDTAPPHVEFAAWADLPDAWKREVDGEREVYGFTFTGGVVWLPHMVVDA